MSIFSHYYPWQVATGAAQLNLSCKLKPVGWMDTNLLEKELEAICSEFGLRDQSGKYHRGGWKAIGLIAHEGDPFEDRSFDGEFKKTPVLVLAPYLEKIIDSFKCEKERVRLMELQPGKIIMWHHDYQTIDGDGDGCVRLHIPLVTNPNVVFQLSHEDLFWDTGELWYADFSFPHRLQNRGEQSRVHLVMDLKVNDYILSLFPPSFLKQKRRRLFLKTFCQKTFKLYNMIMRRKW